MRAPLSVIIPTLNSERNLPQLVECLFEGIHTGLIRELIISDGGSTDHTRRIVESIGAVFLAGDAGRGRQLAAGADAASGSWMLFLHADTVLESGWPAAVEEHIAVFPAGAGYFRLRFRATGFFASWTAGWANVRSKLFGLPYGDQGLLISQELYSSSGGFAHIPLMEDVEIARRLKGRMRMLAATASTDPDRYQSEGWLVRGGRNLLTLARYQLGAAPETLARAYSRH